MLPGYIIMQIKQLLIMKIFYDITEFKNYTEELTLYNYIVYNSLNSLELNIFYLQNNKYKARNVKRY